MGNVVVYLFQHGFHQVAPQGFPFAVDVGVAAPREIDALERTGFFRQGCHHWGQFVAAVAVHDQGVAGFDLVYGVDRYVECGLDYRAFGGYHDDFVVGIVESRADTGRIAQDKSIALSYQSGDGKAEAFGGAYQYRMGVELLGDPFGQFHSVQPFGFIAGEERVDFFVQEVPDAFHHRDGIQLGDGVVPHFHQAVVEEVHIGHVEVAAKHQ